MIHYDQHSLRILEKEDSNSKKRPKNHKNISRIKVSYKIS